ncbi:MAG: proton-conducting transporter membrane subunit, partial [Phycisphaerales bacterium JB038]
PDAMEGPTPVSSIVHSATMVAAGVYLTARIFHLLTPAALLFVATIGLITLVMAALIALVQTDIKRVLAYSTLSQLGYMILGLGCGSYTFALYHLITHAFFKCCLFQCSGSVINMAHHKQELTEYGGFARKMPLTALAFLLSTFAIAGAAIPIVKFGDVNIAFSGFFSKDGIIAGAHAYSGVLGEVGWGKLYVWGPVVIAYITAFYMTRAFTLTFLGKPRDKHIFDHLKEAPWTMVVSQLVLAFFAVFAGYMALDKLILETAPLTAQAAGSLNGEELHHAMEHDFHFVHGPALLWGGAWILSMAIGLFIYLPGFVISEKIAGLPVVKQIHWLLYNKYGFDGLYDIVLVQLGKLVSKLSGLFDKVVVDGIVNLVGIGGKVLGFAVGGFDYHVIDGAVRGVGEVAQGTGGALTKAHSGNIRQYVLIAIASALGAIVLILLSVGLLFASA